MKLPYAIKYTATDGQTFNTEAEALVHEEGLYFEALADAYGCSTAAARYIVEHDLDHHDLPEVAFWGIQTVSSEEDVLYRRYTKRLGIVHGSLVKAIDYAVTLEGFNRIPRGSILKKVDIIELL